MDDLTITKRCAEAMGLNTVEYVCHNAQRNRETRLSVIRKSHKGGDAASRYDPLHDDAQAMALVKKFDMDISARRNSAAVFVGPAGEMQRYQVDDAETLNRAICECVARLAAGTEGGER